MHSSSSSSSSPSSRPAPEEPRPSSSVIILSPTNEVLLLHRVRTSTSFASAHVFPGGNLDPRHDGAIPPPESLERHRDGPAYRLCAVRECFEETGILLAKAKSGGGELLFLPPEQRDEARRRIHGSEIAFGDWLESVGGVADTDGLIPVTRWITPPNIPKRFTTQMYIYFLPISRRDVPSEMHIPTPDGGIEHTAAVFAPPQDFLARAASKSIILFPPQAYLLTLLARFLPGGTAALEEGPLHATAQRKRLVDFLRRVPAADSERGRAHRTAEIPWADKVMSPHNLFMRAADGRVVLGLDKPGTELKDSGRGGDWERVVLVRFEKGGPTEVEVRQREDVLEEEKSLMAKKEKL